MCCFPDMSMLPLTTRAVFSAKVKEGSKFRGLKWRPFNPRDSDAAC